MIFTPSPVTNCHTFSDPLPPWSVTYFMDGPYPPTFSWAKPEPSTPQREQITVSNNNFIIIHSLQCNTTFGEA